MFDRKPTFDAARVSFLIPVRIDTEDRVWNLAVTTRYLRKSFPQSEIIVVEQDALPQVDTAHLEEIGVSYYFQRNDGNFRKAEAVNFGAKKSRGDYFCMYDADVLIKVEAVTATLLTMEQQGWKIALPFNGIFADVKGGLRADMAHLDQLGPLGEIIRLADATSIQEATTRYLGGGIFLVHRETFLLLGGLNRKMISYGWEDTELFVRFEKLGFHKYMQPRYSLVHLEHRRGKDSAPNEFFMVNKSEFDKIKGLDSDALQHYVCGELSDHPNVGHTLPAVLRANKLLARKNLLAIRSRCLKLKTYVRAYGLSGFVRRVFRLT
jgi:GT2 family glycosyltransferase